MPKTADAQPATAQPATAQQVDHLIFELLDPIRQLDDGARQRLLAGARHLRLGPGDCLDPRVAAGCMLYLVQGQVTRTLPGGPAEQIDELHGRSAEPLIPDGLPQDTAAGTLITSVGHSELIGFDRALFGHLSEASQHGASADDLVLKGPEGELFARLMDDFHRDALRVPRLPALAESLLEQLLEHPDDHARLIALVEANPALALSLTRGARTSSVRAAVAHLGAPHTLAVVVSHSMEQACTAQSALVRERMHKAHRHSVEVGAYSYVIVERHSRLDADKALLCGLLHDVGIFAILCRADERMDRIGNGLALDAVTRRLHGVIGGLMLGRWGYDNDVVMCSEQADDWRRDPGPKADYADVVLVAQLHSFIGSSRAHWLPQFATVPAFAKVTRGDPSPQLSRWLLQQGRKRLQRLDDLGGATATAAGT